MTRSNRIIAVVALLGLLTPGLGPVARSEGNASTEASQKTCTISGKIGLAGVKLKGLPGNVVTDENGDYSAEVQRNWAGIVTPEKAGYAFEPTGRTYRFITGDEKSQNYAARVIMFTISGTAGLPDVTMKGLPEEVVTDSEGRYKVLVPYGWTGTVTPVKTGYRFEPPSRQYPALQKNYTDQDYPPIMITLAVSGNVGVPDARMEGLPGNPVTDVQGVYEARVDFGWSGTVTPRKEGYQFEPPSRKFTRIMQDQENQDYVALELAFTISGGVGLPGVVMQGFPGSAVTDMEGRYRVQVPYGWTGQVRPTRPGFDFEPDFRRYVQLSADCANQDYVARVLTFTVGGNTGVAGVLMRGFPGEPISNPQGNYQARVEYGWTGTVAPEKAGYDFTPAAREYVSVAENQTENNYAAEPRMVVISNVVALGDEPIQDVVVTAEPGEYKAITDATGRYSLKVPYGWSGRLSMSKPGFEFESSSISYTAVTSDIVDGKRVPTLADQRLMSSRATPVFPQSGVPASTGSVLVIPTADVVPEKITETTEDMRVMLHILQEKLSEPRMILGVLRDYGSFFDSDRTVEAFYLQGTAAVFVVQVDFPYSFSAKQPDEGEAEKEPADPVWERARQKLYSPPGSRGYGAAVQPGQTQQMTFEQFKEELLRSLKHAANLRNIEPNELVILTVVAQNEDAEWSGAAVSGGTYSGGGGWVMGGSSSSSGSSFGYGGGSSYAGSRTFSSAGGRSRTGSAPAGAQAAPSTTVLTMQAKKADIDAFAKGELDFDQFRQKVNSFTY